MRFEKNDSKSWTVTVEDREFPLQMTASSITNKFNIVTDFIGRISELCGQEFDDWLYEFLSKYVDDPEKRFVYLSENVPMIKKYVDMTIEIENVDFSQFVDESKAKKTSILFNADEIKRIFQLSSYLKLYAIISNSENMRLSDRLHKKIYNQLADDILETEIVFKIFNVIKTKTFRYNLTDRYMWDYIKMIQGKGIDVHVIEIFNFIMNSILVLCDGRNPITYFVGVVDESVKWFLRSVYKGSIIYDDSVATEDIHSQSVNNLKTYSYNDTLGRLKGVAYGQIYDMIERPTLSSVDGEKNSDKSIIEFQNRAGLIKFVSPLCECLVFPVLSRLTNIPYIHFKTISPDHAAVLSVYLHRLLKGIFKSQYKSLFSLLDFYPLEQPSVTTTYKLKGIHNYINIQNETDDFLGFRTKLYPHRVLSYFVGRISRVSFCNIFDGQRLVGIPLSKIEDDMIRFYTLFFANKLSSEFEEMRISMNSDF